MEVNNWQEKTTVKKGTLAEEIIDRYLISKNIIPYLPIFDGAHPFDRLCAKADKSAIYIMDVKAKPSRTYYQDTGIELRHYKQYKHLRDKYKVPVMLMFVDENKGEIYGNILDKLTQPVTIKYRNGDKEYPAIEGGIIYFPLCNMKQISDLTYSQVEELRSLSTRNYAYTEANNARTI